MTNNIDKLGLDLKSYFDQIVQSDLDKFNIFITWTDEDKRQFSELLDNLKKESETTREKGDRLEALVEFIIRKTYFFEVYKNVRTETNEIDEVIVLSDRGKQALTSFGLSRECIPIDTDLILGECKNLKTTLGVTYIGKFYSLMNVTGISFGIVFTQKGLTGKSEGFKEAYGLTKILRMFENGRNADKDFFILTFTMDDYEELLSGVTFFELVKAKKLELQLASNYNTFLRDNKHEAEDQIKQILSEYN